MYVQAVASAAGAVRQLAEAFRRQSQGWHYVFFRNTVLRLVIVNKAIPALPVGGRTKDDAFAVVRDLKQRLDLACVPPVTADGLGSYFYALTAHFGRWLPPAKARTDHWQASEELHYGQLAKRKAKERPTYTHTRMV